jgi:hypothetical protein
MSLTLEPVPPSQTITWCAGQDGAATDDLERPEVLEHAAISKQLRMTAVSRQTPD